MNPTRVDLLNEQLLATTPFYDAAENEPSKVCYKSFAALTDIPYTFTTWTLFSQPNFAGSSTKRERAGFVTSAASMAGC